MRVLYSIANWIWCDIGLSLKVTFVAVEKDEIGTTRSECPVETERSELKRGRNNVSHCNPSEDHIIWFYSVYDTNVRLNDMTHLSK